MSTNEKLAEVLNDLIQINNDRITGYEKAATESESVDIDLKAIFNKMADESRKHKSELTQEVSKLGQQPASDATGLGKLHRVWMDVKATFTGHDRQAILDSCEFGEDVAKDTYKDTLEAEAENLTYEQQTMLKDQHSALIADHDKVKVMLTGLEV